MKLYQTVANLLAVAFLSTCTASPLPYPPSVDAGRMELRVSSPGTLSLSGTSGAVHPGGLRMRVRNASRPTPQVDLRAAEDGAFSVELRGLLSDVLRIEALDGAWRALAHVESAGDGVVRTASAPIDADDDGYSREAECDDDDDSVFPAAPELCDGVDNDCDGEIDEAPACECGGDGDCDDGRFCTGVETCEGGSCLSGEPPDCDDDDPETEDRCDRAQDRCISAEIQPDPFCGNGVTEPGEACDDGNSESGDGCEPDCTVTAGCEPEACNGADDDCDGLVDEDFDLDSDSLNCGGCGLVCSGGESCVDGECVADCEPLPEACNGADDDCDGLIDEDFDLTSDPQNCSFCGNECAAGMTCADGTCVPE